MLQKCDARFHNESCSSAVLMSSSSWNDLLLSSVCCTTVRVVTFCWTLVLCRTRCCQISEHVNRSHVRPIEHDQNWSRTFNVVTESMLLFYILSVKFDDFNFDVRFEIINLQPVISLFRSLWCFLTSLMDRSAVWSLLLIRFHPRRVWLQRPAKVKHSGLHNKSI